MNLFFAPTEDDDILNTTIRESDTNSVMYVIDTPKYARGALSTTATRRNQTDGSMRFAFRILWKGRKTLEDANLVLDDRTSQEVPVREILENAPGSNTYGSVLINDTEYRWRSKGTSSNVVLVKKDDDTTVARSHSRKRSSLFRKPRNMVLEISEDLADAVDIILLTFILVWRERQNERAKSRDESLSIDATLYPLPGDD